MPAEINASDVVDRLRGIYGVTSDTELGRHLRTGTSTVSNWRQRNSVPFTQCVTAALERGVSLDWLVLGRGPRMYVVGDGRPPAADDSGAEAPRMRRVAAFLRRWAAEHGEDDQVWLERTIARAVPEYDEWVSAQPQG